MKSKIVLSLSIILFYCSCSSNSTIENKPVDSKQESKEEVVIPGINAAGIYKQLEEKGFKIDKQFGSENIFIDCDETTNEYQQHVRIAGIDPSKIEELKASYTNFSKGKTNKLAAPFLGFIASVPYDGAEPEKAKEWVESHLSKNSKTEINGVTFEIFANADRVRTLLITPTLQIKK